VFPTFNSSSFILFDFKSGFTLFSIISPQYFK
jgi:hypothetical protein